MPFWKPWENFFIGGEVPRPFPVKYYHRMNISFSSNTDLHSNEKKEKNELINVYKGTPCLKSTEKFSLENARTVTD